MSSELVKAVLISLILQYAQNGVGQQPLEAVVKYTAKDFSEKVSEKNHLILFFVPWNGESKSVAPIYEELGQKYNNLGGNDLVLAKIDCTQEVDLCADQNITDYPTLKFYKLNGNREGVRYRGVRDFHSIEQFLNSFINPGGDFVYGARVHSPPPAVFGLHMLQDENFDNVVQNGNAFVNFCAPWATRCMELDSVWSDLATHFQYDDDITFGQIDCTMHKHTCNEHEVRGYPSLLFFVDGIIEEKYPSKVRDFETLKAWVYKKLNKVEAAPKNALGDAELRTSATILDKNNFKEVIDKEPLIFVNFATPWCTPCQQLDPIWEDLARYYKYKPEIKIANVDCTRNKGLCEENNIQEFPTLNLYKNGILKEPYTGAHVLEELISYSDSNAKKAKSEL